jgi:hypothetical protein
VGLHSGTSDVGAIIVLDSHNIAGGGAIIAIPVTSTVAIIVDEQRVLIEGLWRFMADLGYVRT